LNTTWRKTRLSQPLETKRIRDKLTFGKYILDSLSIGMYSHSLMSLREYIQNSADSIDCLNDNQRGASITIDVDGRKKSLSVHDDGVGIPSNKAKSTLKNIGCSEKDPASNRGFRGIGRLGGLGYCDELRFITKSQGEDIISVCTWDCKKMRQLIADSHTSIDTETLIREVSVFNQQTHQGSPDEHFFKVEMNMIHGGRNDLLNVPAIKSYLSQVAPVPFHPDFRYREMIDEELVNHVKSYRAYNIFVNGQQIYKPYRDVVNLSKGINEAFEGINFIELQCESGILGFGWMGGLVFQGTISPSTDMDGLRLRSGNMMIGNKDSLSGFFRERRFNNYLAGEIHTCSNALFPNSRRDDFEDSDAKDELYSSFIKEIGIPFSRKIRYLSSQRGKEKSITSLDTLFKNASMVIEKGYVSELQKDNIIEKLQKINGNNADKEKQLVAELIQKISNSQHVLSVINHQPCSNTNVVDLFKKTLEVVYSETANRAEAEKVIGKLYQLIFEDSDRR